MRGVKVPTVPGTCSHFCFIFCTLSCLMLPHRLVLLLFSSFLGCVTFILLVRRIELCPEGLKCGADTMALKALCYLAQNMLPVVTDWFGFRQVGISLMDQREGNDVVKTAAEAETWEEGF